MLTGGCECGAIQYRVDGDIHDYSHCHCSQCRRLHGAAFATFAGVQRADLAWEQGEDVIRAYESSVNHQRLFCTNCGSSLAAVMGSEPDIIYLAMGTVDGHPEIPDGYHIYVDSKAPWHQISDDLAQYAEDIDDA